MPQGTPASDKTSPRVPDPSHSVSTKLNYSVASPSVPPDEKWFIDFTPGNKNNFDIKVFPSTIYDLRGQESLTHIDTTGFQAFSSPSSVSGDFLLTSSDEEIARVYYPEVEVLLKKHTGATRVVFFDHTIRKPRPPDVPSTPQTRSPVLRVHVDQVFFHTQEIKHNL